MIDNGERMQRYLSNFPSRDLSFMATQWPYKECRALDVLIKKVKLTIF
jgi:hypothetical protein